MRIRVFTLTAISLIFLKAAISQTAGQANRVETTKRAYEGLPLSFEENRGQTDSSVRFVSQGRGYTLFLGQVQATLALSHAPNRSPDVVEMSLVGANPTAAVRGIEELPGKSNHFTG